MSHITINRRKDFERGLLVNMKASGESLTLLETGGVSRGCVYLAGQDSGTRGFLWTRVLIETTDFEGFVRLSAFVSEDGRTRGGELADEIISSKELSPIEKAACLDKAYEHTFPSGKDMIAALRGRYLFLKVEIVLTGGEPPILRAVRLRTGGEHMIHSLPAAYRASDNGFLLRFLSLYDSLDSDLRREIENLDLRLDFERAEGDALRYIAGWVGVAETGVADDTLRETIRNAATFFEKEHTPEGIRRLIESWTGVRPILVEHFQVEPMLRRGKDRDAYARLFGRKPYSFRVLMPESAFPGQEEAGVFLKRLSENIPAHVESELSLLRDGVYLGWHTYLGINSVVAGRSGATIDRRSALLYDTVIGD